MARNATVPAISPGLPSRLKAGIQACMLAITPNN